MRDNTLAMSIGQRIVKRLEALDLTPNAASKKAGLDRDYIGDLLKAESQGATPHPRTDTIKKLAKALECPASYLTEEQDDITERAEFLVLYENLSDDRRVVALALLKVLQRKSA